LAREFAEAVKKTLQNASGKATLANKIPAAGNSPLQVNQLRAHRNRVRDFDDLPSYLGGANGFRNILIVNQNSF